MMAKVSGLADCCEEDKAELQEARASPHSWEVDPGMSGNTCHAAGVRGWSDPEAGFILLHTSVVSSGECLWVAVVKLVRSYFFS